MVSKKDYLKSANKSLTAEDREVKMKNNTKVYERSTVL